jgi:hypothetical protein
MSPRGRLILWSLIAVGTLVRVVLAFTTEGIVYDLESAQIAAGALAGPEPLSLYHDVNTDAVRWPYPAGYFPWLAAVEWTSNRLGLEFESLVRLLPIACDAALAWVVQAALGDRGAEERVRLGGAALVAVGPSIAFVSGYEGQLDSVAILPAALAFLVWQRMPPSPRRAVAAGLLVGAGAAVKTVPALMLLPLLAASRSRREATLLVTAAVAVPLVTIAPWLAAEPRATFDALRYTGLPGLGGLSLVAQPSLATAWLVTDDFDRSALTDVLIDARGVLTAALVAALAAFLLRRRPEPLTGALVVWTALFAFGLNFGPRYLVWALPFAVMAGRLREAAAVQLVAFPAAVIVAGRLWDERWLATVYVVLMVALLAAFVAWLVVLVRNARAPGAAVSRPPPRAGS